MQLQPMLLFFVETNSSFRLVDGEKSSRYTLSLFSFFLVDDPCHVTQGAFGSRANWLWSPGSSDADEVLLQLSRSCKGQCKFQMPNCEGIHPFLFLNCRANASTAIITRLTTRFSDVLVPLQ